MSNNAVVRPDMGVAQRFLTLLDESASEFTFQTFDDNKDRRAKELARVYHGTLEQHAAELTNLNKAGAGVFIMVQRGDGKGRSNANVTAIRAARSYMHKYESRPSLPAPLPLQRVPGVTLLEIWLFSRICG